MAPSNRPSTAAGELHPEHWLREDIREDIVLAGAGALAPTSPSLQRRIWAKSEQRAPRPALSTNSRVDGEGGTASQ